MSQYLDAKFMVPRVDQYGSHQVMTNVMRPFRKRYVCLDTKHRDDNTNIHNSLINATFTLPERVVDVHTLSVVSAELPMTMYNVPALTCNSPSTNNTVSFTIRKYYYNGATGTYSIPIDETHIISVPYGNYTAATMVAAINAQLHAITIDRGNSTTYTLDQYCVAQLSGGMIEFVSVGSNLFKVKFDVDSLGNPVPFRSSLGWKMGFRVVEKTGLNNTTFTAEKTASFLFPKYLYVSLNDFTTTAPNSFFAQTPIPRKNIIAKLCCDSGVNIQTFSIYNGKLISDVRQYGKTDLRKLQVELIDDEGNVIDLNGEDFSLTLEMECE